MVNSEEDGKGTPGIVYLSSIPPGMAPHDIRTHLSPFGPIGHLYLAPPRQVLGEYSKKGTNVGRILEPHKKRTRFVEGWVEFLHKRDAKTAAAALNGAAISTTNPRQRGILWSIRYLSGGFKWTNLTEQLTLQRAVRDKKLRVERRRARRENEHYLVQVEKASAARRRSKKATNNDAHGADIGGDKAGSEDFKELRIRFKQRKPILQ